MDHDEALERIEIAAAEPGGLERLMAGDTADAAAIAGHVAGCPACAAEIGRIRRTAAIAGEVIRSSPDPALRARTLAYVRAAGIPRGDAAASAPGTTSAPDAGAPSPTPPASTARARTARSWIGTAAAIAFVALGIGYFAGAPARDARDAAERRAALLEHAVTTSLRVAAQPDAERVELLPTDAAPGAAGVLQVSATSGELVMLASGLAVPASGQEYGCWIEAAGDRERIGRLYRAGDLWTWAGAVDGLDALPPDAVFGVSLGAEGGSPDAVPVLTGS